MRIDLSAARSCAKPGCQNTRLQRHHKGCEAMWLRHFWHMRRTRIYQLFKERYESFHPDDVVLLCTQHHAEIHSLYMRTIKSMCLRLGPCRDWTWAEANKLMARLRLVCDRWLKRRTKGLSLNHPTTQRFAQYKRQR